EDTFTTGNQEITIQIVKVPVRDVDGIIIGLLGIFWDITEQKRIKAELEKYRFHLEDLVYKKTLTLNNTNKLLEEEISERKQIEENLIEARNEAEKANKAKNDFLAQMSHNLRTPLNSILGYTQLFLEDTEIMNQYGSQIKMVHQSGLYLSSMINKILDLRNIGTGEMEAALFETEFTNSLTEPDVRNKDRKTDNTILLIPPNEELIRLLELEKVGDIIGIESLINKIEKDDAGYISFVKRIRKFTGLYQTEKLVAYINSLLGRRT
ncbi:MAG: PAS domain-containing protein, partial [Spirochaetaceae bacterium]|nr:PAS domain-containing protein [Spirochaetaceae bacterium]